MAMKITIRFWNDHYWIFDPIVIFIATLESVPLDVWELECVAFLLYLTMFSIVQFGHKILPTQI